MFKTIDLSENLFSRGIHHYPVHLHIPHLKSSIFAVEFEILVSGCWEIDFLVFSLYEIQ